MPRKVTLFSTRRVLHAGYFNGCQWTFNLRTSVLVTPQNLLFRPEMQDKKFVKSKIDQVPGQLVTPNKNTGDIEINVNEAIQSYIIKSEGYLMT
ncbi:hypothetical protein CS542_00550 [Pedobacter sp. IW39]|nr:hypothetical protein CS542_00550 [Pedobacter sp. IW39]